LFYHCGQVIIQRIRENNDKDKKKDVFAVAPTLILSMVRTGKLNAPHMNEGSTIACRHCTSLAEGTTSIKFTSGAKRTATAKPEVLEPRVCGEAGCGHEMPPQGEVEHS
jgi:hypothetical protein